jgi:radical SAM superfamily enzyme YgiQ (UPF0313 family)
MKVLLILPRWLLPNVYGYFRFGHGIFAPTGLISCAAVLENAGHEVAILDAQALNYDLDSISKYIDKFDPDIVGVTSTTPTFSKALEIAKIAKEKDKITVCGGVHASIASNEVISSPFIDHVVRKEGEYTFLELVNALEKNKPLDILGLTTKNNGKIIYNPDRPFIDSLDQLPMPAYHLLDIKRYKPYAYQPTQKRPFINIMLSRGCPNQCTFCDTWYLCGRKLRAFSPQRVINELKYLRENFGITNILFFDDTLTMNQQWINEILDLMIKEKLDITWNCLTRVDCVNSNLLKKMKKTGCEMIAYGVESGSQHILDAMKKGITLDQIRKAFKWTREADIVTRAFFILGYFGETRETIRKTIEFAKELNPDFVNFSILEPFLKTEAWEIAKKNGMLPKEINWDEFSMFNRAMKSFVNDISKEELVNIMKEAHQKFYLRSSYILKIFRNIKSLPQLISLIQGGIGVLLSFF